MLDGAIDEKTVCANVQLISFNIKLRLLTTNSNELAYVANEISLNVTKPGGHFLRKPLSIDV